ADLHEGPRRIPERAVARVDRHRHHRARCSRRARRDSSHCSQTQVTDSFWRDPPWRGGKGGYRMGLRPIDASAWLPDLISASELDRKRALLDDGASGVFAALDDSIAGQQKILEEVMRYASTTPSAEHARPDADSSTYSRPHVGL